MKYVKTFENYNKSYDLEPIETIEVSRDRQRNVYLTDGNITIWVDDIVPHNFLKKSYQIAIIDYIVLDNDINKDIVDRYNGFIDPNIYTEEGFGHIGFNSEYIDSDDALQYAIDFFKKEQANLITN